VNARRIGRSSGSRRRSDLVTIGSLAYGGWTSRTRCSAPIPCFRPESTRRQLRPRAHRQVGCTVTAFDPVPVRRVRERGRASEPRFAFLRSGCGRRTGHCVSSRTASRRSCRTRHEHARDVVLLRGARTVGRLADARAGPRTTRSAQAERRRIGVRDPRECPDDRIPVRVLAVEFAQPVPFARTAAMLKRLDAAARRGVCVASALNWKLTFVARDAPPGPPNRVTAHRAPRSPDVRVEEVLPVEAHENDIFEQRSVRALPLDEDLAARRVCCRAPFVRAGRRDDDPPVPIWLVRLRSMTRRTAELVAAPAAGRNARCPGSRCRTRRRVRDGRLARDPHHAAAGGVVSARSGAPLRRARIRPARDSSADRLSERRSLRPPGSASHTATARPARPPESEQGGEGCAAAGGAGDGAASARRQTDQASAGKAARHEVKQQRRPSAQSSPSRWLVPVRARSCTTVIVWQDHAVLRSVPTTTPLTVPATWTTAESPTPVGCDHYLGSSTRPSGRKGA